MTKPSPTYKLFSSQIIPVNKAQVQFLNVCYRNQKVTIYFSMVLDF
nr:MAG TPA: hypothetical protein [Caudoviricetes sp.]